MYIYMKEFGYAATKVAQSRGTHVRVGDNKGTRALIFWCHSRIASSQAIQSNLVAVLQK